MSKLTITLLALGLISASSIASAAKDVTWSAKTFAHRANTKVKDIDKRYCKLHSPDSFKASTKTLLTKGTTARNGVFVKFKNYNETSRHGMFFTEIYATFSGTYHGKKWEQDAYINEQKLTPQSVGYSVWSTKECKGFIKAKAIR